VALASFGAVMEPPEPYGGVQTNQQVEQWVRGRKFLDEKCFKEKYPRP
jgi:hypothetical protein